MNEVESAIERIGNALCDYTSDHCGGVKMQEDIRTKTWTMTDEELWEIKTDRMLQSLKIESLESQISDLTAKLNQLEKVVTIRGRELYLMDNNRTLSREEAEESAIEEYETEQALNAAKGK